MVALSKVKGKGIKGKASYLRSVGAVMIIVRSKPNTHSLHESFPCPYCYGKLKDLGIPIYYSTESGKEKKLDKYLKLKQV